MPNFCHRCFLTTAWAQGLTLSGKHPKVFSVCAHLCTSEGGGGMEWWREQKGTDRTGGCEECCGRHGDVPEEYLWVVSGGHLVISLQRFWLDSDGQSVKVITNLNRSLSGPALDCLAGLLKWFLLHSTVTLLSQRTWRIQWALDGGHSTMSEDTHTKWVKEMDKKRENKWKNSERERAKETELT